jgi:hypothetical protein
MLELAKSSRTSSETTIEPEFSIQYDETARTFSLRASPSSMMGCELITAYPPSAMDDPTATGMA